MIQKFSPLTPKGQEAKATHRDEQWISLTDKVNANAPERTETNLLRVEVENMIEDQTPASHILAQVLVQLTREQARTANALEDIRDLLESRLPVEE